MLAQLKMPRRCANTYGATVNCKELIGMSKRTCSIEECDRPSRSRGWCATHYDRWYHHGDPLGGGRHFRTPQERFSASTEWSGTCLLWTGSTNAKGYGTLSTPENRSMLAHRFAWEQESGPIPKGMQVDHACWNPACVNVEHLRLASSVENGRNRSGANPNNRTSGVRGVTWSKHRRKWVAQIGIGRGKTLYLGGFESLDEAARVAQEARDKHFQDYAGRHLTITPATQEVIDAWNRDI